MWYSELVTNAAVQRPWNRNPYHGYYGDNPGPTLSQCSGGGVLISGAYQWGQLSCRNGCVPPMDSPPDYWYYDPNAFMMTKLAGESSKSSKSSGSSTYKPKLKKKLKMSGPLLSAQDLSCPDGFMFSVYLVPECSLEFSEGIVYSIGDQWIDVAISGDTRECLPGGAADIRVNGSVPPVFVTDGSGISVSLNVECDCTSDGPICEDPAPLYKRRKMLLKRQILKRFRKLL